MHWDLAKPIVHFGSPPGVTYVKESDDAQGAPVPETA
jgi:hypothetical protein